MNVGLYFCACGAGYVSDFAFQTTRCLECSADVNLETEPTSNKLSILNEKQIEHLWKLFSKVTFDTRDEVITERFLFFLPTTNRFAIWLWFADRYTGTFTDLPGKLIWQEKGRVHACECNCGQQIPIGSSCFFNATYGKVLCDTCGKREMTDLWLFAGYRNPWIRTADDPFFDRKSFCEVKTVDELIEKLRYNNWCIGDAFVFKNLALINQVGGGGEWLAIKDWCTFDSITFQNVIQKGEGYARLYIQKLLDLSIKNRKLPDYSLVELL